MPQGLFALDQDRQDWLRPVVDVVAGTPEIFRGFLSALGWVDRQKLQGRVVDWLKSDDPLLRRFGLGACSVQRADCGVYLARALEDADDGVRELALRSVGQIRRRELAKPLGEHLQDDHEGCRFWAAWSATLLGESEGVDALRQFVTASAARNGSAMELVLRAMDTGSAMRWVRELVRKPGMERQVVQPTGIIGDPVSIPWLNEKMRVPECARVAGESFSLITGIDLAYDDLERDWPEGFEAGPTENPEDEDVAMDAGRRTVRR